MSATTHSQTAAHTGPREHSQDSPPAASPATTLERQFKPRACTEAIIARAISSFSKPSARHQKIKLLKTWLRSSLVSHLGTPMVKDLPCNVGNVRFNPWWGTKISHDSNLQPTCMTHGRSCVLQPRPNNKYFRKKYLATHKWADIMIIILEVPPLCSGSTMEKIKEYLRLEFRVTWTVWLWFHFRLHQLYCMA